MSDHSELINYLQRRTASDEEQRAAEVIADLQRQLAEANEAFKAENLLCDALTVLNKNQSNTIAVQRAALVKIADWHGAWGPYPERNEAWCAMAIMTARETVPQEAMETSSILDDRRVMMNSNPMFTISKLREEVERLERKVDYWRDKAKEKLSFVRDGKN